MNTINALTMAADMGYFYGDNIKEIASSREVAERTERKRMIEKLREDNKKVQLIYNTKGQIIKYYDSYNAQGQLMKCDNKSGRHLEVFA